MTPEQEIAHIKTLAKGIGVCPIHRDPTEVELAHTRQWRLLRIDAYRERTNHEFSEKGQ